MVVLDADGVARARELKAAGIESGHAEAIAEGMRRAAVADRDELATKVDISGVNGRIGILQWVVGIQSAITLATFAVVAAKLL